MKTNLDYFNISESNPEELLDQYYTKNLLVIPEKSSQENELTLNNQKLINLITTFCTLKNNYENLEKNNLISEIIKDIIQILESTKYINYSAFTQFFMVHNSTFSAFKELKDDSEKHYFIYSMLIKYCDERHNIYLEHNYSNIVLQVLADNYSHKRNSKTTIDKFIDLLKPYKITHISNLDSIHNDNYYFLPDKGNKNLFDQLILLYDLKLDYRQIEHSKLPDVVLKFREDIYICELKSMKGTGGGQNKQIVEIAYFIKFSEHNKNIHFLTFLDSDYSNRLFTNNSPKIRSQRDDIINSLRKNHQNYFLNTFGLKEFFQDLLK